MEPLNFLLKTTVIPGLSQFLFTEIVIEAFEDIINEYGMTGKISRRNIKNTISYIINKLIPIVVERKLTEPEKKLIYRLIIQILIVFNIYSLFDY